MYTGASSQGKHGMSSRGELDQMISLYFDRRLDAEGGRRLKHLIDSDPAAARSFAELSLLHASIQKSLSAADLARSVSGESRRRDVDRSIPRRHGRRSVQRLPRRRRRPWLRYGLIPLGAAAALFVIVYAISPGRTMQAGKAVTATVAEVRGEVTRTRGGKPTPVRKDDAIRPGATLEIPQDGHLRLRYLDGTTVALGADTQLMVVKHATAKRLKLVHGELEAEVAEQAPDAPMTVATPGAEVRVLGTQFKLVVKKKSTRLEVTKGTVRLTRIQDRKSVDVAAGQYVVAARTRGPITIRSLAGAPTPGLYSQSFERGLPANWHTGRHVTGGLPPGSKGAVRQAWSPSSKGYQISCTDWNHGLFTIRRDRYFNFTCRMERPGWFNVLLVPRSADKMEPLSNLIWVHQGKLPAGEWRTVSVPLSEFRLIKIRGRAYPDDGSICYGFGFGSGAEDRRLVIDRIWISTEPAARAGAGNK